MDAHDRLILEHRSKLAGYDFPTLLGTYIACSLSLHCVPPRAVNLCGPGSDIVYRIVCETMAELSGMPAASIEALACAAVQELARFGILIRESVIAFDDGAPASNETIH